MIKNFISQTSTSLVRISHNPNYRMRPVEVSITLPTLHIRTSLGVADIKELSEALLEASKRLKDLEKSL